MRRLIRVPVADLRAGDLVDTLHLDGYHTVREIITGPSSVRVVYTDGAETWCGSLADTVTRVEWIES